MGIFQQETDDTVSRSSESFHLCLLLNNKDIEQ